MCIKLAHELMSQTYESSNSAHLTNEPKFSATIKKPSSESIHCQSNLSININWAA